MHKCHDLRCLAEVQFAKWKPIWNGTAKEINTVVIDYSMYKDSHLAHNCWTCVTWSADPNEEADMHSYQPINRHLRGLKLVNPLTNDYH
jgi:hypothetical protein